MTTIVTRAGKGSPLTNNEVDTNFTNLNSAKIETLTSTDSSVTITGTGDSRNLSVPVNPNVVSGPASATDNAVARFDGTTGKLIQNSTAATIDDNGNADFLSQKADFFDVDTAATTAAAVGRLRWDAAKGTAVLGEVGGNLEIAVGQTLDAYVTNAEAVTITKGQAVYLFSATGNRASVKLAFNTSDATSAKTFGVAAENITAGGTGLVRCVGVLDGLNLGSYNAGDILYLGATAGTLTATKPSAPNHLVYVGLVERANNGNGQLYVRVQNGYELDEIHDVQINSGTLANGQTILYDAATSLWKNANLTAGTGISITNGASSVTIANTGVISVSGTSPVLSSGGATPAISLASGYGDTQNPYASKTANNFLAAPNGTAGVPTFRAIVAADIPTLNQNTTGTASNVTGTVAIANGGTGATSAATALTNLGAYPATNPNGYTSNTGTVTSVSGTGTVSGLTLSGTVTTSGSLTLGGTLSAVTSAVAGTGISVSGATGAVTFTNTGVTSVTAGSGISVSASTGGVTITNTSTGATITDDTTTNATRYILFDDATSGTLSSVNTSSTKFTFNPSTGTLTVGGDVVSSSDESLKTNWKSLDSSFIAALANVKSGIYDRIDTGVTQVGVSAQSLQNVIPEAVHLDVENKLTVAYGNAALAACVELAKEVVKLRQELEALKGK